MSRRRAKLRPLQRERKSSGRTLSGWRSGAEGWPQPRGDAPASRGLGRSHSGGKVKPSALGSCRILDFGTDGLWVSLLRSGARHPHQLACDIRLPVSNAGITHVVVLEFAGLICLYRPLRPTVVPQLHDLPANRTRPRRHHRSPFGGPDLLGVWGGVRGRDPARVCEQRKSISLCGVRISIRAIGNSTAAGARYFASSIYKYYKTCFLTSRVE
jgi:hypothetical protein